MILSLCTTQTGTSSARSASVWTSQNTAWLIENWSGYPRPSNRQNPTPSVKAVKAKQSALSTVAQKIGEAIYASDAAAQAGAAPTGAAGATGPDAGATGAAGPDDDVVDAEIVDEDEK